MDIRKVMVMGPHLYFFLCNSFFYLFFPLCLFPFLLFIFTQDNADLFETCVIQVLVCFSL